MLGRGDLKLGHEIVDPIAGARWARLEVVQADGMAVKDPQDGLERAWTVLDGEEEGDRKKQRGPSELRRQRTYGGAMLDHAAPFIDNAIDFVN